MNDVYVDYGVSDDPVYRFIRLEEHYTRSGRLYIIPDLDDFREKTRTGVSLNPRKHNGYHKSSS